MARAKKPGRQANDQNRDPGSDLSPEVTEELLGAVDRDVKTDPRTRAIAVVVLTSSKVERDILHSYRLGGNGYVRKPVDFAPFRAAVKELGAYWLSLNEPPPAGAFPADGPGG
jgi:hypothetical protein